MRRQRIFVFRGEHEDDFVCCEMYSAFCEAHDVDLEEFSIHDENYITKVFDSYAEDPGSVLALMSHATYIFVHLSDPENLLHMKLGLPLIIYWHDHPAYMMHNAPDRLENTIVMFGATEHEQFWRRYRDDHTDTVLAPVLPGTKWIEPDSLSYESYLAREPMIFAPMHLSIYERGADEWWEVVDAMNEPLGSITRDVIAGMIDDPTANIDAFIDDVVQRRGIELERDSRFNLSQIVDSFARMWRRTVIINALIEFPIIISSKYIPVIYREKYAHKFVETNGRQTLVNFRNFRYILNISPAVPSMVHDRIHNCVLSGGTLISESSKGIQNYLKADRDFVAIPFDGEKVAEKVSAILESPERSYEMAMSGNRTWHENKEKYKPYGVLFDKVRKMARQHPLNVENAS
jgi:hypothetical protein